MDIKEVLQNWSDDDFLRVILNEMAEDTQMKKFIDNTIIYLKEQSHSLQEGFKDIDDSDDSSYYLTIKYVELKTRWIQMNLRLSYQAFKEGEGRPEILLKAGATTRLLASIEPFVSKSYIEEIQVLLAQPVIGRAE